MKKQKLDQKCYRTSKNGGLNSLECVHIYEASV